MSKTEFAPEENIPFEDYPAPKAEVVPFEQQYVTVFDAIADVVRQKKALDDREKTLKQQLQAAMEKHSIKKVDTGVLRVNYFPATASTQIDSAKVKLLHPEIVDECSKTVNKAAYIKIALKDAEE